MNLYQQTTEDYLTRRLPSSLRRERLAISAFGGADTLVGGGAVEDMVNMSPRRAPALATRPPRGLKVTALGSGTPHGMVVFGGDLYFARGTVLYRMDSEAVTFAGTVSDTDKRFFVFGDRLYIYPDKLYMEAGVSGLKSMELDSGVIDNSVFKGNTVTLPSGMSWTALGFGMGDCLRVLNADDDMPAPEGYYRITDLRGRTATLGSTFPATYESSARFLRVVPDLERVCVNGDRVYGVSGKDVYVSAAGNALDFYSSSAADGSGPVILHLDTEGDITACTAWQGYVVFFKADRICKLLGTRSDSFTLQDRPAVGISDRLADTLCEVGGDLYYLAEGGVYRYRGQEPERISVVERTGVRGGCGGTDGYAYYLAVKGKGDQWRQYCYLPETEAWYAEDDLHPSYMIYRNGFLYVQGADGNIWMTSSDGRDTNCVYDERKIDGAIQASVTLPPDYGFQPEGCRLAGIYIRATSEEDENEASEPTLEVLADYADGAAGKDADGSGEISLGLFSGKMTDRLLRIPVPLRLSDGVRIRLVMEGDWVIHAVTREYERAGQ